MSKNLFDFGDEEIKEELKKTFEKTDVNEIDEKTKAEAKNVYDKYKDFSQEELVDEFLKTSKSKLKEGALTQENIDNTISKISPFLNPDQKEFLKSLMRKLDE